MYILHLSGACNYRMFCCRFMSDFDDEKYDDNENDFGDK